MTLLLAALVLVLGGAFGGLALSNVPSEAQAQEPDPRPIFLTSVATQWCAETTCDINYDRSGYVGLGVLHVVFNNCPSGLAIPEDANGVAVDDGGRTIVNIQSHSGTVCELLVSE